MCEFCGCISKKGVTARDGECKLPESQREARAVTIEQNWKIVQPVEPLSTEHAAALSSCGCASTGSEDAVRL